MNRAAAATLDGVLAYDNDAIPRRFLDDWDLALDESRALFDDVKRWLFLCTRDDLGFAPTIYGPLTILDEAWHNFVLFTADYTAYCTEHYGRYIHHAPTTHDDRAATRAALIADLDAVRAPIVDDRARQREAVIDYLGLETLLRWYVDYPQRYGDEFFATRRKPLTVDWKPDPELIALAAALRSGDG